MSDRQGWIDPFQFVRGSAFVFPNWTRFRYFAVGNGRVAYFYGTGGGLTALERAQNYAANTETILIDAGNDPDNILVLAESTVDGFGAASVGLRWNFITQIHPPGEPPDPIIFDSIMARPTNAWEIASLDVSGFNHLQRPDIMAPSPVPPPEIVFVDQPQPPP